MVSSSSLRDTCWYHIVITQFKSEVFKVEVKIKGSSELSLVLKWSNLWHQLSTLTQKPEGLVLSLDYNNV